MRRTVALSGLFVATFLAAVPVYLRGLVPLDEGALVHVADRLAAGEVLYRDVATGVMPGAYYALSLLYRLFGPSLETGRLLQAVILAAGACLTFNLADRFASSRVALWTAVGFVALELFAYRYPNYSPPAILLILIALSFFFDHLKHPEDPAPLIAAGLCLGLSLLFKQNYATFVALALGGVLLRRLFIDRNRGSALRLASFGVVFLAPFAVVLVLLAGAGALDDFLRYSVFGLVSETLPSFYKPYPLFDLREPFYFRHDLFNYTPFPPIIDALAAFDPQRTQWLWSAFVVVAFLVPAALLAAAGVVVAGDLIHRRARDSDLALVATAGALFAGVFPRSDFHHLALVAPPLLIVLAWLWQRASWRLAPPFRRSALAAGQVVILLCAAPPYLSVFFRLPERLDTPLGVARAERIKVSATEATNIHLLLDWLDEHTEPGAPLLVVPNDPILYFLAGRPNPSPYPLALPGSFDEIRLVRALARVDVVVARDVIYDSTPLATVFPRLAEALRHDFAPEVEFLRRTVDPPVEPLQVLVRRPSPPSGAPGRRLDRLFADGRHRIVTFDGREVGSAEEGIARVAARSWLQRPSLLLRPPSGWQKLLVELPLQVAAGETRLELSLALRPPRSGSADGAFLETYLYDSDDDRLERLGAEWIHPHQADYWIGRPLAYSWSVSRPTHAVLLLATSSGPHLSEDRDELVIMDPRLVPAPLTETAEPGVFLDLPGEALRRVAAFDDRTLFEEGLEEFPRDAQVLGHLAVVDARAGRGEDARTALAEAVRLDDDDAQLRLALAEAELAAGEKESALAQYEALLDLDPGHPRALAKSAELLAAIPERRGEALRRARRAVRMYPQDVSAHVALAWVHLAHQDPEAATDELTQALVLGGDSQALLDSLNRHAASASLAVPGGVLTRAVAPLPDEGFSGRLTAASAVAEAGEAGGTLTFTLTMINRAAVDWHALGEPDGRYRVSLLYRWLALDEPGERAPTAEGRILLPADVAAGSSVAIPLRVPIPQERGAYRLEIDAVQEGVARFSERGAQTFAHRLEVR